MFVVVGLVGMLVLCVWGGTGSVLMGAGLYRSPTVVARVSAYWLRLCQVACLRVGLG